MEPVASRGKRIRQGRRVAGLGAVDGWCVRARARAGYPERAVLPFPGSPVSGTAPNRLRRSISMRSNGERAVRGALRASSASP